MEYSYNELKHTKIANLREIASKLDHPAVQGYTQLNKDHLLEALCKAFNIDTHEHHEIRGIDKGPVKQQIRELKKQREEAVAAHDHTRLKEIRRRMHSMKRTLRKSMV